jgi:predicted NAD-dependent protein-ADP-ribosyltransferase YbiA (DUF1768 family)
MMAEKARLFGDEETRGEIPAARSPREHKALGRKVRSFDADRWTEACREIVYRGNVAKFSQNVGLGELLLATGDRTLERHRAGSHHRNSLILHVNELFGSEDDRKKTRPGTDLALGPPSKR